MEKTTVLYCESNIDGTIGGSFYSLLFLVEALDPQRFRRIVVFYQDHSLIPRFRASGIEVLVLEPPKPIDLTNRAGTSLGRLFRPFLAVSQKGANAFRGLILQVLKFAQLLKNEKIDLIHLNNSVTRNHPWMIAARLSRVPCITHERGINTKFSLMSSKLAKGLNAIICISHAVRRCLEDNGIGKDNLHVIYNGLDPDRINADKEPSEIRSLFGISEEQPVIGIVGNIKEWKGQESVVRAVKLIKERIPNISCLLVGDTSPSDLYYEKRLRNYVEEVEIQDNVVFTGYQQNVGDFINIMDVVIHASMDPEPFGRVLLEAMAMRKPIVGARAGAIPEIIEEGKTGMMFEPGDAAELAECITELISSPKKAVLLGNSGYDRLRDHFHINKNVEQTMGLYGKVLGKSFLE